MKIQAYTPGPWEIDRNGGFINAKKQPICRLKDIDGDYYDNAMENASLIASAPELLTILKMILEYDETTPIRKPYTTEVYKPLTNLLREKAKQVIAKAEGS